MDHGERKKSLKERLLGVRAEEEEKMDVGGRDKEDFKMRKEEQDEMEKRRGLPGYPEFDACNK